MFVLNDRRMTRCHDTQLEVMQPNFCV